MRLKSKTFRVTRKKGIQSMLVEMTPEEKFSKLEKILSDDELEQWLKYNKIRQRFIDRWNAGEHTNFVKRHIEMGDEYTFPYERRIFGDVDAVPDVDMDDFEKDIQDIYKTDSKGNRYKVTDIDRTNLEKAQKDYQMGLDYTREETDDVLYYGGAGSTPINAYIRQKQAWLDIVNRIMSGKVMGYYGESGVQSYIKDIERTIQNISNAIARGDGLLQNTKLYRGGFMEKDLRIGDVSSFEGFTSTSFNEASAEAYTRETGNPNYRDNYMITILAPKGTKGVAVNGLPSDMTPWAFEHEFLLNHGQEFVVLDIDHDAQTATILLVDD